MVHRGTSSRDSPTYSSPVNDPISTALRLQKGIIIYIAPYKRYHVVLE